MSISFNQEAEAAWGDKNKKYITKKDVLNSTPRVISLFRNSLFLKNKQSKQPEETKIDGKLKNRPKKAKSENL